MTIDDSLPPLRADSGRRSRWGRSKNRSPAWPRLITTDLSVAESFSGNTSYLDLDEVVSTELGYPVRVHYAYTYIREGQRVFRYDNAPHHPEIATHPHHKHIARPTAWPPPTSPV